MICLVEMLSSLLHVNFADTKPFVPQITLAKVIKVYDGDTITVAAPIHDVIYRFSIRLLNVDAPEIRSKHDFEKHRAIEVRDNLHALLFHKFVCVKITDNDKYGGRYLGYVWSISDGMCINKYLLENKFAVVYDGRTKCQWSEAMCQGDFSNLKQNPVCEFPDLPKLDGDYAQVAVALNNK